MEDNKLSDNSNQRKYWMQIPQIAHALSRTPQDFTLWSTVYMIAGEGGKCILSTPDLAELAMMSTGKASDCRAYLLAVGLLIGECTRDPGYPQPVWHLRIPDFWEENIKWRKANDSLKGRIGLKRHLKKLFQEAGIYRNFDAEKFKDVNLKEIHLKSFHIVKPSQYEKGIPQNERKKNHIEKPANNNKKDKEPSLLEIFGPPQKQDTFIKTDAHQRHIDQALSETQADIDPIKEIAKHLYWGIQGAPIPLPTTKRICKPYLNAAVLMNNTVSGQWRELSLSIDLWYEDTPKDDKWTRINITNPANTDLTTKITRYHFSRLEAAKQEQQFTNPSKVPKGQTDPDAAIVTELKEQLRLQGVTAHWVDSIGLKDKPNGTARFTISQTGKQWLPRLTRQVEAATVALRQAYSLNDIQFVEV